MRRRTILQWPLLAGAAGALPILTASPALAAETRPCLLVSGTDFDELRGRAATEPWKSWKSAAISRAGWEYVANPDASARSKRIAEIASYSSLAYILDAGENAPVHAQKVLQMVGRLRQEISTPGVINKTQWGGTVPQANALFHLVLGLDVVHAALTSSERASAETQLGEIAATFADFASFPSWTAAPIGAYGTWLAYRVTGGGSTADLAALGRTIGELEKHLQSVMGKSGAYLAAPTYVGHRLGSPGDRDPKSYFVDVLSREPKLYSGVPGYRDYYQDPHYQKAIEFYAGYLTTPVTRRLPRRRLTAEANVTVRGGKYAGDPGESGGLLHAKVDEPDFTRECYLRFDLGDLTADQVVTVRLRLYMKEVGADGCRLEVSQVGDVWPENVSWSGRPAAKALLGTWIPRTRFVAELDVTTAVRDALTTGSRKFSVGIRSTVAGAERFAQLFSRQPSTPDEANSVPRLLVNTTTDVVARDEYTFGDSATIGGAVSRSARTYSAYRFSTAAGSNAAWSLNRVTIAPLPMMTTYALTAQAPSPTVAVPSRVFPDAGAWFLQNSHDQRALAGALWNAVKDGGHQHRDTNSLHLAAYGEHVLRNSGYNGYPYPAVGFTYAQIRDLAVLSNTGLIGYEPSFADFAPPSLNNHVRTYGAGIVEDLMWGGIDYATGDSGGALPNGRHRRSLVFVHPNTGTQGYWTVFDEFTEVSGAGPVGLAWHPNSASDPAADPAMADYTFPVDVDPCTDTGVKLTAFLATPPSQVHVKSGPLADWTDGHLGRYLYVTYPPDAAARKNAVTVLFPSDDVHPKAAMSRVGGTGYSGASITHTSGHTDYAIESKGSPEITIGNVTWQGWAAWYRTTGGASPTTVDVTNYLVRKGRILRWREYGFETDSYVSILAKGRGGQVLNTTGREITVTFYHPGLSLVRLDREPAATTASGSGWRSVIVPAGRVVFELVTT
ncbi:CBM96 family carbohydrate-binding protein [Micromonospora sp. WMMC250]|uniref:CBM96 family carbohydrate-binding protein n=1 Tax=Micromonospora sp. WMMC250 TaxID=3014781 RepID=UPI0022B69159|nr:DNRLRE domain-containing protein [Micromonospora sp. WMMC250]MCZ7375122.1 DNRLRE domain-containing protein [Micromonospora sp. WMMC250]